MIKSYNTTDFDTTIMFINDDENVMKQSGTIGDFVERLYTVAMDRASEKEGKTFWINEISKGDYTGADCGRAFLFSDEFMNRNLSIDDFVETLYQTFFGRESEPDGKAFWTGALKEEQLSRQDVINGFIESKEWCNICADYGVKSGAVGAKADKASKNSIEFASRLYTKCLGRDAEEGGLIYWSLALTNLEVSGSVAAKQFFYSEEFISFNTSDTEYLTRLYRTFMGREPENDGLDFWIECMKGGMTRDAVFDNFVASQEFTNICKEYGIDR